MSTCVLALVSSERPSAAEVPTVAFDIGVSLRKLEIPGPQAASLGAGPAAKTLPPSPPEALRAEVTSAAAATAQELEIGRYEYMNSRRLLARPEKTSVGGAGDWTDAIFSSEVVKLKRMEFSGSILTAFKRKNPLCLLHPLLFRVER